jgi:hypothetical protein
MVVEKKHIMIFKVPPGYIEGFVKGSKWSGKARAENWRSFC